MFIYYLLFFIILTLYLYSVNYPEMSSILLLSLVCALSLFVGFRALDVSRDGVNYAYMFDSALNYYDWFNSKHELMTIIIPVTLKDLGVYSYVTVFTCFAIIGVSTKLIAIKKYSPLPLLSVLIYYSHFFILHEMTQIRAGIASGIFLLAIEDIAEKRVYRYLIKIGAASLFHISALVYIFLYFINTQRINKRFYLITLYIFVPILSITQINVFSLIPGLTTLSTKLAMYAALQNGMQKVNLMNSLVIFFYLLLSVQLMFLDRLIQVSKYSTIFINLLFWGIISLFVFSAVPVLAWRISELFTVSSIVSITYLYYIIRPRLASGLIIVVIAFILLSLDLLKQGLLQPYHTLLG